MRNSDFDYKSLDSFIESCLSEHWLIYTLDRIWLRSAVADNPLSVLEQNCFLNQFRIETKNFESLVYYTLFRFYHPVKEYGYLMLLELESQLEKNPEFFWLKSILSYKSLFLEWLLSTELISYRSFLGLIKNEKKIYDYNTSIVLCFQTERDPKRVQRRRGYRDKGTLPDYDAKAINLEFKKDWSTRLEQEEIESQREIRQDTISILEGFLM